MARAMKSVWQFLGSNSRGGLPLGSLGSMRIPHPGCPRNRGYLLKIDPNTWISQTTNEPRNWWTMNSKFLPKDGRIPPKIKNLPCLHRLGEFQLNSSLVDANPHETDCTKWKLWLMDRIRRTTGENTVNHGICFTAAGAGFCQRYVRLLECIQSFFSRVSLRNVWNTFLPSGI